MPERRDVREAITIQIDDADIDTELPERVRVDGRKGVYLFGEQAGLVTRIHDEARTEQGRLLRADNLHQIGIAVAVEIGDRAALHVSVGDGEMRSGLQRSNSPARRAAPE